MIAARWRTGRWVIGLGALGAVPFANVGDVLILYLSIVMVWGMFALAFDLSYADAGLLSVGHGAFFGTGSYVTALLMLNGGWGFFSALFVAGVTAAAAAALFSVIALRLSGLFFALVTLALAELVRLVALTRLKTWTGGYDGIPGVPRPVLGSIDFNDSQNYYLLILAIFALFLMGIARFRSSPFGRAVRAVRTNEVRASQLGFNVRLMKVATYTLSGFIAGIAGGLLASLLLYANPDVMSWLTSGDVIVMTLLGGTGTLLGPVVGVAAVEGLRHVLSPLTVHWHGIVGILFILATIFLPTGLVGLWKMVWRSTRAS